jgi:hypothetical protein
MFFKICRGSTVDENAHQQQRNIGKKKNFAKSRRRQRSPAKQQPLVEASPVSDHEEAAASTPASSRLHAGATSRKSANSRSTSGRAGVRKDFLKRTALGTGTEHSFCTPESLPSLEVAFSSFKQVYPRYQETVAVDYLREREYAHLGENGHVCMDYYGFGLFSQWQQVCVSLSHPHTHTTSKPATRHPAIAYSHLQVQLWIQYFFTSLEFQSLMQPNIQQTEYSLLLASASSLDSTFLHISRMPISLTRSKCNPASCKLHFLSCKCKFSGFDLFSHL